MAAQLGDRVIERGSDTIPLAGLFPEGLRCDGFPARCVIPDRGCHGG